MITAEMMDTIHRTFSTWYTEMFALIAEARASEMTYIDFYGKCAPFLAEVGPNPLQRALRSVHVGTLMICFQIGFFFLPTGSIRTAG